MTRNQEDEIVRPGKKRFKKTQSSRGLEIIKPFKQFMQQEASGGIILLACVIVSLVWINSPLGHTYVELWSTNISFTVGSLAISKPLLLWINDLLMTFFFLLIGLELKREILIGEISTLKTAMLPVLAAIGGLVLPAIIYLIFNPLGSPTASGWAIPIATDIAIALGLLSLFGKRVPMPSRVFLTTLAIVDDIAAIVVITVFYSDGISATYLALALLVMAGLIGLNKFGVRNQVPYVLLGAVLWLFVLESGVHPALVGILVAMVTPASTKMDYAEFAEVSTSLIDSVNRMATEHEQFKMTEFLNTTHTLEMACNDVETPLQKQEMLLAPWVIFFVLPLFALANGGIILEASTLTSLSDPVSIGILLGLVIGKPLGVLCMIWLATRLGYGTMLKNEEKRIIVGISVLTGIGFTMSTFIATLSFSLESTLATAKASILLAFVLSALVGLLLVGWGIKNKEANAQE
ncbi:MAG: Na+/H+ antiporter NhaA [Candidatus Thorarchaeota archaeon]